MKSIIIIIIIIIIISFSFLVNKLPMEKHVMFIAFGSVEFYNQANILLLSLLAKNENSDFYIHIYTDDKSWLPKELLSRVQVYLLTKEEIVLHKGPQNFIHRVKIALLQDLCLKVTGRIIYLDTDCVVFGNFSLLFDCIDVNKYLMHMHHFSFQNLNSIPYNGFEKLVQKLSVKSHKNLLYGLSDLNFSMWNAGVIGLQSNQVSTFFDDVYNLTSYIYDLSHSHTSEQLAFSVVMQKHGNIKPAKDYVYHYWEASYKDAVKAFVNKDLSRLNCEFLNKGCLTDNYFFENFASKISKSYLIKRNESITYFENNHFGNAYKCFILAFLKKPFLDKLFFCNFLYHTKRFLKFNLKKFVSRI